MLSQIIQAVLRNLDTSIQATANLMIHGGLNACTYVDFDVLLFSQTLIVEEAADELIGMTAVDDTLGGHDGDLVSLLIDSPYPLRDDRDAFIHQVEIARCWRVFTDEIALYVLIDPLTERLRVARIRAQANTGRNVLRTNEERVFLNCGEDRVLNTPCFDDVQHMLCACHL